MNEAPLHPVLAPADREDDCLLGNEAIVRGALEANVAFASGYPGTPSSEITDTFAQIAESAGIVFEYSVNEKVALEMAFAASLAGARSICAMKHLGLMSAGDPLSTIPYIGVEAGMVIVSAGDPSCRTSPNEQDQRRLGPTLHIPVLDPSTPAEALSMTRFAFELSERSRLPVLLRVTTRVCHSRAPISRGPLGSPVVGGFRRNPPRYVPIPVNARRMRLEIKDRLKVAEALIEESPYFVREGAGDQVVLATGAPAAICGDLMRDRGWNEELALWSLGTVHPLPTSQLLAQLEHVKRLLIVEELSPFLEDAIRSLVQRHGLTLEILGKRTGHLPEEFEYDPATLERAFEGAFNLGGERPSKQEFPAVPPRPPSLCPGCGHRAAFLAARMAFDDDQLFFSDIGCYTLGYGPPLHMADAVLSMGAGFTLAAGVSRVTGKRTVGFMGDSTFFHSGMPALLNVVKENVNMVAVILDNRITAMTGFQESPTSSEQSPASIEGVVRAIGAKHVAKVDPYDVAETVQAFESAKRATGVSVVIVERPCPIHVARSGPKALPLAPQTNASNEPPAPSAPSQQREERT